jgi:hypothetical protein
MSDWTNIPDATFDPDKPILGSTHLAIVKNFNALAAGDAGAPRISARAARQPADIGTLTVTASDAFTLQPGGGLTVVAGDVVATGASFVVARTITVNLFSGVIRFRATHEASTVSGVSTLRILKNGSVLDSWSTTSPAVRIADVSIVPTDVIVWEHQLSSGGDGFSSVFAFQESASDAIVTRQLWERASLL